MVLDGWIAKRASGWIRKTICVTAVPMVVMGILMLLEVTFHLTAVGIFCAVIPRTLSGLKGVVLCWLMHWNYLHYFNNMTGWIGLVPAFMMYGFRAFVVGTTFIQVCSAASVWIVGRSAAHAGVSGVLCGYFSFLMSACIWIRPFQFKFFVAMMITAVLYFSIFIASIFTFNEGISWELHLFGFLYGAIFAWIYRLKYRSLEPPTEDKVWLSSSADIIPIDLAPVSYQQRVVSFDDMHHTGYDGKFVPVGIGAPTDNSTNLDFR